MKALTKVAEEGNYLKIIKSPYGKPTINVIINDEEGFSLRSETR